MDPRLSSLSWLAPGGPPPGEVPKSVWGPEGWDWVHSQAICFPAEPALAERLLMQRRFWAFILLLPCPECRAHATEYARAHPPDLRGSAAFQTWAWRFHNAVNYRLGKPLMSAAEYVAKYGDLLALARRDGAARRLGLTAA